MREGSAFHRPEFYEKCFKADMQRLICKEARTVNQSRPEDHLYACLVCGKTRLYGASGDRPEPLDESQTILLVCNGTHSETMNQHFPHRYLGRAGVN